MIKLATIPIFISSLFMSGCEKTQTFKALENHTEVVCIDGLLLCKTTLANQELTPPIISYNGPCKTTN